jgi:glutamate synthase domain-containing protein 3
MPGKKVLLTVLLAGTVIVLSGCVAVAVGVGAAGTVAYVRGDLEAVEPRNLADVYEATEKALEELELRVAKKEKDALSGTIVAKDSRNKTIKIKLHAGEDETTKLSIRIGMFGSETKSRLIYEKIKDNLE